MKAKPACPLCGAEHWEVIGENTFSRASIADASEAIASCLQVLFNLWVPGEDEIRIHYVLCQRCGMVVYRPRPSEAEVDSKYRFLHELIGRTQSAAMPGPIERQRSLELFRILKPYLGQGGARVLDFGGYRGALMTEMARFGCDCSVVDYAPDVLPGLTRLGDTLSDIEAERKFELIVCSHVLEHLVEPLATCKELAGHLGVGGLLFVEVPLEILGHAPLQKEPVTHINFFSKESLSSLLQLAGLRVERCWEAACTVGNGRQRLVVRALGQAGGEDVQTVHFENRAESVRALIGASRIERWSWRVRHPRLLLELPEQGKKRVRALLRRVLRLRARRQHRS